MAELMEVQVGSVLVLCEVQDGESPLVAASRQRELDEKLYAAAAAKRSAIREEARLARLAVENPSMYAAERDIKAAFDEQDPTACMVKLMRALDTHLAFPTSPARSRRAR